MRVDSKKNKKIKGTGLGLAIAKQLAEQMDGMIWVESVYGKGSSFFVQLPMKKVSDGKISNVEWKETDERKRRSFVAPQAKILIVDDNPENLMVDKITSEAYSCVCGYSSQRRGMCPQSQAKYI